MAKFICGIEGSTKYRGQLVQLACIPTTVGHRPIPTYTLITVDGTYK